VHGAEGSRTEKPLHQAILRVPEGSLHASPLTGAEPVKRDGEVVHPDLRHSISYDDASKRQNLLLDSHQ